MAKKKSQLDQAIDALEVELVKLRAEVHVQIQAREAVIAQLRAQQSKVATRRKPKVETAAKAPATMGDLREAVGLGR